MTPQQVLLKAADVLGDRDWCRGTYEDKYGRVCVAEAISVASRSCDGSVRAAARLRLRQHIGLTDIELWNDSHGRTKEEVIAALRAAAEA